jgi:hypothetical protein
MLLLIASEVKVYFLHFNILPLNVQWQTVQLVDYEDNNNNNHYHLQRFLRNTLINHTVTTANLHTEDNCYTNVRTKFPFDFMTEKSVSSQFLTPKLYSIIRSKHFHSFVKRAQRNWTYGTWTARYDDKKGNIVLNKPRVIHRSTQLCMRDTHAKLLSTTALDGLWAGQLHSLVALHPVERSPLPIR